MAHAEGGVTTRGHHAVVGEDGSEAIIPLSKYPGLKSLMAGNAAGAAGNTSVSVNVGSIAPGLLDLPTHVLSRVLGDGAARALQRRGDVRRQVQAVGAGKL